MILSLQARPRPRWTSYNDVPNYWGTVCIYAYAIGDYQRLYLSKDWTDSGTGYYLLLLTGKPGRVFRYCVTTDVRLNTIP